MKKKIRGHILLLSNIMAETDERGEIEKASKMEAEAEVEKGQKTSRKERDREKRAREIWRL